MTNEELIKALREVANWIVAMTYDSEYAHDELKMLHYEDNIRAAADIIEAQAKRIEELEAQMPKEGEWIDDNGAKVPLDRDGYTTGWCQCSVCGDWLIASDEYEVRGRYCPNCGSRMAKGEQDG